MKLHELLALGVGAAVVSISSIAPAAPPLIPFRSRELEEGRSFHKTQTAVPSVSEAAGQVTYSYAIDVPRGRGVTPRVELEYTSSGRQSEFGWGWELTLPTIARTQRLGVAD